MSKSEHAESDMTVGQLGESGVLRRVLAQLSDTEAALLGPGDDSAVLRLNGDLVVTSDTMIEGTDFRLDWHSGFELGWKLAATNLSDVAAMGAVPIGLTVSLACPRDTPVKLLEEISAGLNAACGVLAPGCGIVGGDLATAPVLTAAITALGEMRGSTPVTRAGAQLGDLVAYAGELGLSGLGLSLLYRGEQAPDELWETHAGALAAHLAPTPPIPLGVTAQRAGATAMMDVSDSLSLDAHRMGIASRVSLDLSSELLVTNFGEQAGEAVALTLMLSGGEDHGLLATFPPHAEIPAGFRVIGTVREQRSANEAVSLETQCSLDGEPFQPSGWDTFESVARSR